MGRKSQKTLPVFLNAPYRFGHSSQWGISVQFNKHGSQNQGSVDAEEPVLCESPLSCTMIFAKLFKFCF